MYAATEEFIQKAGGRVDYGSWNANAIFPIWGIAGIAYGMVELIRRVILLISLAAMSTAYVLWMPL